MKNWSRTFCLVITVFVSPVWSETIDDLVERNGKYYLKFSEELFNGKLEGRVQGTLRDGVWDGKYTEYWDSGRLRFKGHYKNGVKDGFWEKHLGVGEIEKGNFKSGEKNGYWVDVGATTGFKNQGNYVDGVKEGKWEQYFDYDGNLSRIVHYKKGVLDGSVKKYHTNSQLISNVSFRNGCLNSLGKFFHSNGQLKSHGMYKKLKEDCFEEGFGEGEFQGILMYQNGKKDGLWELFNEDGTLQKTETYKNGVLVE